MFLAPAGCDGLLFLPYLMGERCPIYDPKARACFVGLSAATTRAHMCRAAVLEGICFAVRCTAHTNPHAHRAYPSARHSAHSCTQLHAHGRRRTLPPAAATACPGLCCRYYGPRTPPTRRYKRKSGVLSA